MEIGRAIRFCRQQRRLKQPELAKLADLSASYLSLLEQGKRDPSLTALEKIARSLGVPLSVLVFLATTATEQDGMPSDMREKLSAAAVNLLMASTDERQQALI